jgi:hypothetical protein
VRWALNPCGRIGSLSWPDKESQSKGHGPDQTPPGRSSPLMALLPGHRNFLAQHPARTRDRASRKSCRNTSDGEDELGVIRRRVRAGARLPASASELSCPSPLAQQLSSPVARCRLCPLAIRSPSSCSPHLHPSPARQARNVWSLNPSQQGVSRMAAVERCPLTNSAESKSSLPLGVFVPCPLPRTQDQDAGSRTQSTDHNTGYSIQNTGRRAQDTG